MAVFKSEHKTWEDAFYSAIDALKLPHPDIINADGEIHRFSVNGKRTNSSGWYIVFQSDIVGGCVGNWATGEKKNFFHSDTYCSESDMQSLQVKWTEARKKADEKRKNIAKETELKAQEKWSTLSEPNENHPYLVRKKIKPHNLKLGKQRLYSKIEDEFGNIVSLQSIDDKGQKIFMEGGRVKGCYSLIGSPTDVLCVAEGYATAASINEATGFPVASALFASNINDCIVSLKQRFPNVLLILCADNDEAGKKHAEEAIKIHKIRCIYPDFTTEDKEKNEKLTDFNDFVNLYGKEKLLEKFEISKKENKFNLLTYEDVLNKPRSQWLIKNIIPKKSFVIIYGEPGKGKTFVALDMAMHIAHGIEWFENPIEEGCVLYIAGEGVGGLPKRLRAWTYYSGKNLSQPKLWVLGAHVNMREPTDVEQIINAITSLNQKFSAVIIDTVARSILGGDENSSTDMGLFVASCDKIKEHTGATVIGIHHSGKDQDRGMRGSSALLGAVDAVINVSQDVPGQIQLKCEKQKDGELFQDMFFETKIISTGITDTSLVIEKIDSENVIQKPSTKKPDLALTYLYNSIASDTLKSPQGEPATTLNSWRAECYSKELGGDTPESKRQAFHRAKNKLQQDGKIACLNGIVWAIQEAR